MPRGNSRRRLLWGLGGSVLGLAALVLLLPVWFPWVLRPLARHNGATFSRYARLGYGFFELEDFNYADSSAKIHAARVRAQTPNAWVWHRFFVRGNTALPFIEVEDWRVEPLPSTKPPTPINDTFNDLSALFPQLSYWIPLAHLKNGVVQENETRITLPKAIWQQGRLHAEMEFSPTFGTVVGDATVNQWPWRLELSSASTQSRLSIQVQTNTTGMLLRGDGMVWSNRLTFESQFGRKGQLPESGTLRALDFRLPTQKFLAKDLGELAGSVSGTWQQGNFGLDLESRLLPPPRQTNQRPFAVSLHLAGNTNALSIETARISAPWVSAELSQHVVVGLTGPLLRNPAVFRINADLNAQTMLPAQGILSGNIQLAPSGSKFPSGTFQFRGEDVGSGKLKTKVFTLSGTFTYPNFQIERAAVDFIDGTTASLQGAINAETKTISSGKLQLSGPLARRWLPSGWSISNAASAIEFSGPVNDLSHSGTLSVSQFSVPALKPLNIELGWQGQQTDLRQFKMHAATAEAALDVAAHLQFSRTQAEVELESVSFQTNHQLALQLSSPTKATLAEDSEKREWSVKLETLRLRGAGGNTETRGSVTWPSAGSINVQAAGLSSKLLEGLLRINPPELKLKRLNLSAHWTNGPVLLSLGAEASGRVPGHLRSEPEVGTPPSKTGQELLNFTVRVALATEAESLVISNMSVFSGTGTVLSAKGRLPVSLHPAQPAQLFQIAPAHSLQLTVATDPKSILWQKVADWTGLKAEEPQLEAELSGTLEEPRGVIKLGARQLSYAKNSHKLPDVQELRVTLHLDKEMARLTEGRVFVQGEPVSFTAEIPLGLTFWRQWRKPQLPDLTHVKAHLWIDDAELAAFEPFFPTVLAPQGRLKLDVSWLPGGHVRGELDLQRGRTRPIANFGAIRDINVRVRIQDRALALDEVSAKIGSAPLTITGKADLSGTEWLWGELPPFQISVVGSDIPLARQPESIIRSDLALAIAKTNGAPPLISGRAHLRDSYFLSELRDLAPGQVTSPARRPPYFSIEDPALADWRLALDVDGAGFLKVRSTLFNGEASANLKILGTLKDPIALGDVKIDSGVVRFPFASLSVQQGLVTLSSQDPYHPQLSVTAASKQFGYDLRMEVRGAADEPIIQFSSTPPLSSEQIVLMVTAGQMPQGTFTLTAQQRAQTVAMFLGRDLLAKLGFADQTEQRLTIQSGEEISEQGRPTYHVEYKLTKDWSLVGEYDRFGDYNAGVKWRIYSK